MSSDIEMKKLIEISEEFLKMDSNNIEYEVIARNILSLCNAKYVIFNLFHSKEKDYTTVSLEGRNDLLGAVSKLLGFSVVGRRWPHDPKKFEKIMQNTITELADLDELIGEVFSSTIKNLVRMTFKTGKVYILKISKEEKMLGTFHLIMGEEDSLEGRDLLEVYARQTGLLLERIQSEKELKDSEKRFKSYSDNAPCGLFIIDTEKMLFKEANLKGLELVGCSKEELQCHGPYDLKLSDDRKIIDNYIEKVLKSGKVYQEVVLNEERELLSDVSVNGVKISDNQIMALVTDISEQKKNERNIQSMNLLMKTLLDNTPQAFVLIDKEYKIIEFNKKSDEMSIDIFGKSIIKGDLIINYIKSNDRDSFACSFPEIFSGKERKTEVMLKDKNKNKKVLEITIKPVLNENEEIWAVAMSCYDITDLKNTENALRISEERFKSAALSTSDLIYELDLRDNTINWFGDVNKFSDLGLAVYPETLRSWISCIHPDDRDILVSFARKKKKERKPYTGEYRLLGADKRLIYVEDYAVGIYDEEKILVKVVGAITDITSRKYYEEQLKFLSFYDQLTEVYNRSYFEEEIKRLNLIGEYPISIISIDVDGLKLINDTLGHYKGDEQLKGVAQILKKSIRNSDILARTGGDEFAVILPFTETKIAERIVERINENVNYFNGIKPDIPISISIGLANSLGKDDRLEDVFKKADDFMYRSKLSKGSSAKSQIIKSLMAALAERDYITEGHASRLSELSLRVGERLRLSIQDMSNLDLLAKVHDLGKVGIPDSILFKPGPLNADEWEIMKLHPEKGFRIAISSPDLAGIADLILKHHERWDGNGYPTGIKEDEIPLECRIISVVDSYDAMINERPYSKARTKDEAIEELRRCSGSQFDPAVVEVFLQVLREGY